MKYPIIAAVAAALALSGCGQAQKSETKATGVNDTGAAVANQSYSGTGKISAIAGDQVSIAHGPIAGIGWPAMTMTFTAPSELSTKVGVGDRVDFSFHKDGSAYLLTSLRKR
jgi:Cu(I)/Ag(I) efflux system protein CusF